MDSKRSTTSSSTSHAVIQRLTYPRTSLEKQDYLVQSNILHFLDIRSREALRRSSSELYKQVTREEKNSSKLLMADWNFLSQRRSNLGRSISRVRDAIHQKMAFTDAEYMNLGCINGSMVMGGGLGALAGCGVGGGVCCHSNSSLVCLYCCGTFAGGAVVGVGLGGASAYTYIRFYYSGPEASVPCQCRQLDCCCPRPVPADVIVLEAKAKRLEEKEGRVVPRLTVIENQLASKIRIKPEEAKIPASTAANPGDVMDDQHIGGLLFVAPASAADTEDDLVALPPPSAPTRNGYVRLALHAPVITCIPVDQILAAPPPSPGN